MRLDRRQFLLATAAAPLLRAADPPAAARVRGMMRLFVSDVEDKPWFNDREMWPALLTCSRTSRFNRFQLAFGLGYDFLRDVTDAYFLFRVSVSARGPRLRRARGRPCRDAERDRNLETLQFISEQTAARGLHFQLGLWTHGYEWANSPHANYTIDGLTAENHAAYCRDALTRAAAAPAPRSPASPSGFTARAASPKAATISGKPSSTASALRAQSRDRHARQGHRPAHDRRGLATGLPVTVSPKFWAEHMGMPYHQAAIREQEMPHGRTHRADGAQHRLAQLHRAMAIADLLREDRRYSVLHRVWPGTQRLLIWGDPVTASAYARASRFCGSSGAEIMEPLSFKGRRVRVSRAAAAVMRTLRSIRDGTGRSTCALTKYGARPCTIPIRACLRRESKRRSRSPAAFCPS